jgi:drug/metabolite transporter (DMT)-like permease
MLTPVQIPTARAKPAGPPAKGRVGTALAVFYIFLWASAYVPSKVASTQSPPLWFLAARFLAAGLVLVGLAVALRRPWPKRQCCNFRIKTKVYAIAEWISLQTRTSTQ